MDELKNEKNKTIKSARKVKKEPAENIKKEIKENYEIGIEYFMNLEEYEDK